MLVYQHSAVGRDILVEVLSALDAVVSTDGDSDRPLVLGVERGRVRFLPGDILGMVAADFLGVRSAAVPVSASDALLPILALLYASLGRGMSIAKLLSTLPTRFGRSSVLRPFPRDRALAIVAALSPANPDIVEARFEVPEGRQPHPAVLRAGGTTGPDVADERLAKELARIRGRLEGFFTIRDGFGPVAWTNWLDGVRVGFANGDVAHVRPSGNAPELRIYVLAGSPERADAIVARAVADNGIIRTIEAAL